MSGAAHFLCFFPAEVNMMGTTPPPSAPLSLLVSNPAASLTKPQSIRGNYINLEAWTRVFVQWPGSIEIRTACQLVVRPLETDKTLKVTGSKLHVFWGTEKGCDLASHSPAQCSFHGGVILLLVSAHLLHLQVTGVQGLWPTPAPRTQLWQFSTFY